MLYLSKILLLWFQKCMVYYICKLHMGRRWPNLKRGHAYCRLDKLKHDEMKLIGMYVMCLNLIFL